MNLYTNLLRRAEEENPIRVGLVGAGKFGTMFLSQVKRLKGIHLVGIADLSPQNARSNLAFVGWDEPQYTAQSLDDAAKNGATHVGDDWQALVSHPAVDIVIECTGAPIAAVDHILTAFENGKHVINVTVEADAFCGFALAKRAEQAGVIYSMAYGDQPALTCDLVDWARACGFNVTAAGRGHKWLPKFRKSTPETIWDHWGISREIADRGRLNPKMFNSFLDGSKPAIESSAIANACDLHVPSQGLQYPVGGAEELANIMRPKDEGGCLEQRGMVEVASSLTADGEQIPYDIRQGVWVVFEGDTEYLRNCFQEYKVRTDDTGRYTSLYKRWHLIGLELPISVASIGTRDEPTGFAKTFNADVVAVAKRDLTAGEGLDGEGGYTVTGGLRPAKVSVEAEYLPLGLAQDVRLKSDVKDGEIIRFEDVDLDQTTTAYQLRKWMEALG
ncbi:MAG: Gfo/Idh/MocA family oxidoreductase [Rhizobiaceae bacterium]